MKRELGQYFTTSQVLQKKVVEFVQGQPELVLEPCFGRGDLVQCVAQKLPSAEFHLFEVDSSIEPLEAVRDTQHHTTYCDFLQVALEQQYPAIITNPPYVRIKRKKNLYLQFIEKCWRALQPDGQLIAIVPSDFFKATAAAPILKNMLSSGSFTHFFHPHNEHFFQSATIDICVFRYHKGILQLNVEVNGEEKQLRHSDGMITFLPLNSPEVGEVGQCFHAFVGMISGLEDVFKVPFGNKEVLTGEGQSSKYIFLDHFPSSNPQINNHLLQHKQRLLSRRIRKFNQSNWFQWGAIRNAKAVEEHLGAPCLYLHTITRRKKICFRGTVQPFAGNLLMLLPKVAIDIEKVMEYCNSEQFMQYFVFAGRFKIGQRQLLRAPLPIETAAAYSQETQPSNTA